MHKTAKLRTAIYMRVSTADQCVDSQRQELLQFIGKREDLELAGEYADVISGTREKREQLDRLMIDARQRKIDVVLFFDLSRLTRKGLSHTIGLLDEWQQAGVKPICYAYPMLARKVFFRRRKLRSEAEMTLDDGTVVCSGTVSGMGVLR